MTTQPDPVRAGFEAVRRRPSLLLVEVCWRWAFGIAAAALIAAAYLVLLHPVPVSDADRVLLDSGSPLQFANAVADIVTAIKGRLLQAIALVLPGLVALWTFAAALGRFSNLPELVRQESASGRPTPAHKSPFRTLLALSFGRAALLVGLLGAYLGSVLVAAVIVALGGQEDLWLFLLLFCSSFVIAVFIWSVLNWLLGIAPVFAVRDGRSAFGSLADTLRLLTRSSREVTRVTAIYAFWRLIAIVAATVASVALLVLHFLPRAAVLAGIGAITLIYFLVADYLFIARLAGYAAIPQAENATPHMSHRL